MSDQFSHPGDYRDRYSAPVEQKSRVIALLLCFFLGGLGIHNFYYGQTGMGIAKLILTGLGWLTAIILIGFVFLAIASVWVLIDLILIALGAGYMATDSRGVPTKW